MPVRRVYVVALCFMAVVGVAALLAEAEEESVEERYRRLPPEREAALERMTAPELVAVLKDSTDFLEGGTAFQILMRERPDDATVNALFNIAAMGNGPKSMMIVEGLADPVAESASTEEKRRVDLIATFLEDELANPDGTKMGSLAAEGLGRLVRWSWKEEEGIWEGRWPALPYAYHRCVKALLACLDHPDLFAREAAVRELYSVGRQDPAMVDTLIERLKKQQAIEAETPNVPEEKYRAQILKRIEYALRELERGKARYEKFLKEKAEKKAALRQAASPQP